MIEAADLKMNQRSIYDQVQLAFSIFQELLLLFIIVVSQLCHLCCCHGSDLHWWVVPSNKIMNLIIVFASNCY